MLISKMSHTKDRVNLPSGTAAEIEHILDTVLDRKTNQGLIFAYLGGLYLRGEDAAKEHTIAVEALGRGTDFDPKREAIVRVEVHKLRRSLKNYYTGPGQDRPVHIELRPGKYALAVESAAADVVPEPELALAKIEPAIIVASITPPTPSLWKRPLLWLLVAILGAGATYLMLRERTTPEALTRSAEPVLAAGVKNAVRILAGGAPDRRYVDTMGQEWLGDRYFTGGHGNLHNSVWIQNTPDQGLYKGHREGDFTYEIPLAPGNYEARIHFAETTYGKDALNGGGEASRLFQVLINGKVAVSPLDVILSAGGSNLATVKVFHGLQPEPDGKLRIRFESNSNDKAFVNAIEIVPGLKDRMLPLRIAAGASQASVDIKGRVWQPDRYAVGGRPVERLKPVQSDFPELFRFERFGRFEYTLPAIPGHQFQVNLWMAEQYFGVHTPAGDKPRRVFDLFHNGTALLRDFSILDAAGGPAKAAQRTFSHLRPDAQGNIRLLFQPSANYAALNAIELIDEGPTGRFR